MTSMAGDRDPMTGAFSNAAIASMRAGAMVAMTDIIGFKAVNDRYGAAFGDEVLKAVAVRLIDGLSPLRVYRFGGDEFMVEIDPPVDHEEAERLALRILALIGAPIDGLEQPLRADVGITLRAIEADVTPVSFRANWAQWQARTKAKRYVIEGAAGEVWSG